MPKKPKYNILNDPLGIKRRRAYKAKVDRIDESLKMREKRVYEATQIHKEQVRSESPNQRNHWQAKPLRDQARHLYQNDPIARRCVDSVVSNMVGMGILPMAQSKEHDERKKVQEFLDKWTHSNICDYDGIHSLPGLQAIVVKALVRDGSVFVHKTYQRKKLKLQVLEADYLDVFQNRETERGGYIENGIEFDSHGRVIAYHIYEHHPDDSGRPGLKVEIDDPRAISTGYMGRGGEVQRIRAANICHIRRVDRPNQQDGVSWLAPALEKIWDLHEYEQAKLIQQKIQCSFTGFVTSSYDLSEDEREDLIGESENNEGTARSVQPGTIEELPIGKTVVFPPQAATPNELFVERTLRSIAGAIGVSYEIFNDYSQVNFSSGRMGFIEMDRQIKHHTQNIIIPQFLEKIGVWIIDHLKYHDVLTWESEASIKWVIPPREMIDPNVESNTMLRLLAAGLISYQEAHMRLGKNFEKNLDEIVAGLDAYNERGLPTMRVQQGLTNVIPSEIQESEEPDEAKVAEEAEEVDPELSVDDESS